MIRLNMNENPFLPPQNVIEAANKGLQYMNRYSDTCIINDLRKLIAGYNSICPDSIIVGAGAGPIMREVIQVFGSGRKVITTAPFAPSSLQYIKQYADGLIKIQLAPPKFKINQDIIIKEADRPVLLIIDNPNNPTGSMLLEKSSLKEILDNENIFVLVDEAYYEFCSHTFLDLIYDYPNLAVARSMDKAFSLAGLRVGYLIAGDSFKRNLAGFRTNLSQPALYAAIEALKNFSYVKHNVSEIIKERERLSAQLDKLGFTVYSSNANFLLVKSRNFDLAKELIDYKILIADLSNVWLAVFYRITVGTHEENSNLLAAVRDINSKKK